jgi:hypothetical protein
MTTTNNSIEYIRHLLSLGIDIDHALMMVENYAHIDGWKPEDGYELLDTQVRAIYSFNYWGNTRQGFNYWSDYAYQFLQADGE